MSAFGFIRVFHLTSSTRAPAGSSALSSARFLCLAAVATVVTSACAATPQELLRDLWNISRDKNAAFEAVTNAYVAVNSLTNLTAQQRGDAAKSFQNAHASRGRRADALAFAETAATDTALPVEARAALLSSAAQSFADENKRDSFGAYRHDGFDKAGEISHRIGRVTRSGEVVLKGGVFHG